MKKILIGLCIIMSSISAKAADYTISVQPTNSGSQPDSLKWFVKFGSNVVATESKDKSLSSFYATSYGSVLPVNASANKIAISGDQILFETADCSGTPYYASLRANIMTNRGVMMRPITNSAESKTILSRLSNYPGELCSPMNTTSSVFSLKVCSAEECPFAVDSSITFVQQ